MIENCKMYKIMYKKSLYIVLTLMCMSFNARPIAAAAYTAEIKLQEASKIYKTQCSVKGGLCFATLRIPLSEDRKESRYIDAAITIEEDRYVDALFLWDGKPLYVSLQGKQGFSKHVEEMKDQFQKNPLYVLNEVATHDPHSSIVLRTANKKLADIYMRITYHP